MLEVIRSICEWNKIAGNHGKFNRHLEASMLIEELSEVIIALKKDDVTEVTDGILDIFWVGIGTLYKMGISPEQIYDCFKEIQASNFSKFKKDENNNIIALKDETGKILKPDTYFKPNLEKFLK